MSKLTFGGREGGRLLFAYVVSLLSSMISIFVQNLMKIGPVVSEPIKDRQMNKYATSDDFT